MGETRFPHGISSFGVPVLGGGGSIPQTTGTYYFVDDSGSNANDGKDTDHPFVDLDYAIGQCTANAGDVIIVMPGHAETRTTTITLDVAGVTIVGLGDGDLRPTITVNAAVDAFTITAADSVVANIKVTFGTSSTIATRWFVITGGTGLAKLIGCHFEIPATEKAYNGGYILGASGALVTIKDCVFENLSTVTIGNNATWLHTCLLIRTGDVDVIGCRFLDMKADKKNLWEEMVTVGSTGTNNDTCDVLIKDTVFNCRGVAVAGRAAAVSANLSIVNCHGISTSSNTGVDDIFQVTYANMVDTHAVGAVAKRAQVVPGATE